MPQAEEMKVDPAKAEDPALPAPMDTAEGLQRQRSTVGEDEKIGGRIVSYTTMPAHMFTQFRDDAQLKKLEEMLEYIKTEVEKGREKIRTLDKENEDLRGKFKDVFSYAQPQSQQQ